MFIKTSHQQSLRKSLPCTRCVCVRVHELDVRASSVAPRLHQYPSVVGQTQKKHVQLSSEPKPPSSCLKILLHCICGLTQVFDSYAKLVIKCKKTAAAGKNYVSGRSLAQPKNMH